MQSCYYIAILLITFGRLVVGGKHRVTCYYDTFSINRLGTGNFTGMDLRRALPLCDNIIYGYIGLNPKTFAVTTLHSRQHRQFLLVKTYKRKYRSVKFVLSLGGDKDLDETDKYLNLLKADTLKQKKFIQSAEYMVRKYSFDGMDLAFQLPKKFVYNNGSYESPKTQQHCQQMTRLIRRLRMAFMKYKLMLTLTVLPNVDAKSYYNVPAIIKGLDFVTVAAFDFSLPLQTPKEANYLAPIYAPPNVDVRFNHSNVYSKLLHWTTRVPSRKLNLGIAAYGRTWNTTKPLKNPKMPIVDLLNGPGAGGHNTRTPGLLAWPEICKKLAKISNVPDQSLGNFAYRPGVKKTDQGLLITYESPDSAAEKVEFARRNKLGGVALFDITLDDYRGKCHGTRYEMLKSIRSML